MSKYVSNRACRNGHVGLRYTQNHGCVECALKRAAKQKLTDPETAKRYRNTWRAKDPSRESWHSYRFRAKRKNREFTLDRRLFNDLITDNCYYCHQEPNPFNGIDRMDSSRGYVEGNVVTACEFCNKAKRDLSLEVFEEKIRRIAEVIGG